jgi:hypothetical protein
MVVHGSFSQIINNKFLFFCVKNCTIFFPKKLAFYFFAQINQAHQKSPLKISPQKAFNKISSKNLTKSSVKIYPLKTSPQKNLPKNFSQKLPFLNFPQNPHKIQLLTNVSRNFISCQTSSKFSCLPKQIKIKCGPLNGQINERTAIYLPLCSFGMFARVEGRRF